MQETQTALPRYPAMVRFRCPAELAVAIAAAADRNAQSVSDYLRQLVLRELRKSGVRLNCTGARAS